MGEERLAWCPSTLDQADSYYFQDVAVVDQSCLTLSDPMDCSLPGSLIHEIFQARVLERGAITFILSGYINKRNVFLRL